MNTKFEKDPFKTDKRDGRTDRQEQMLSPNYRHGGGGTGGFLQLVQCDTEKLCSAVLLIAQNSQSFRLT